MKSTKVFEFNAVNISVHSENRIHSDDGARNYGFAGGLVSGSATFAYACEAVRQFASDRWLTGGFTGIRFEAPVYDGEKLTVTVSGRDESGAFVVANPEGRECARGSFSEGNSSGYSGAMPRLPVLAPWSEPKPMESATFLDIDQIPSVTESLSAQSVSEVMESLGLDPAPYLELDVVPVAYLARLYVLMLHGNFRWIGPGIHAGAQIQVLRPMRFGEETVLRSRIDRLFARGAQRFWAFEIGHFDSNGEPAVWNWNSAIYQVGARTPATESTVDPTEDPSHAEALRVDATTAGTNEMAGIIDG